MWTCVPAGWDPDHLGDDGEIGAEAVDVDDATGAMNDSNDIKKNESTTDFLGVAARHKARLGGILCVCFMSAGFWTVYEQQAWG